MKKTFGDLKVGDKVYFIDTPEADIDVEEYTIRSIASGMYSDCKCILFEDMPDDMPFMLAPEFYGETFHPMGYFSNKCACINRLDSLRNTCEALIGNLMYSIPKS